MDSRSLDFQIKTSLLAYPSLFQSRAHVINHLYLVLGNGYDWRRGVLVDHPPSERTKMVTKMLLDGAQENEIKVAVQERFRKDFLEHFPRHLYDKLKDLGIDPDDCHYGKIGFSAYPVHRGCAIASIPDDVRPDWLAGAREALFLMESGPAYDERSARRNRRITPLVRRRIEFLETVKV